MYNQNYNNINNNQSNDNREWYETLFGVLIIGFLINLMSQYTYNKVDKKIKDLKNK